MKHSSVTPQPGDFVLILDALTPGLKGKTGIIYGFSNRYIDLTTRNGHRWSLDRRHVALLGRVDTRTPEEQDLEVPNGFDRSLPPVTTLQAFDLYDQWCRLEGIEPIGQPLHMQRPNIRRPGYLREIAELREKQLQGDVETAARLICEGRGHSGRIISLEPVRCTDLWNGCPQCQPPAENLTPPKKGIQP